MTDNGICSLLGLARRAGKLAAGDEPVRELSRSGVVRVVLLASDAGAAVSRQARFLAERAEVPLLTLPVTGAELGGALGRKTCAVCALSDSGFAAKAAEKLAAIDTTAREAAETLAKSHARFQARRSTKKHRQQAGAPQTPREAPRGRAPERGRTVKRGSASARNEGAPRSGALPGKREHAFPKGNPLRRGDSRKECTGRGDVPDGRKRGGEGHSPDHFRRMPGKPRKRR